MKFNWGTGIFLFLALFLLASAAFIIYALNQDVELVHDDYYEKGTDYTNEMNKTARSAKFESLISISEDNDSVKVIFPEELDAKIDSGNVLFFRPSDKNLDKKFNLISAETVLPVSKKSLISGRYILKINWFDKGVPYEVDKEIVINKTEDN
jgi:hypothetical protein